MRWTKQGKGVVASVAAAAIAGMGLIGLGATAAQAASGQYFTYFAAVFDEAGEPVVLDYDLPWDITMTSGATTYENDLEPHALNVEDPVGGDYTLKVVPAQSGLVSTEMTCSLYDFNDVDLEDELAYTDVPVGGSSAAGWQIPVSGTLSTVCMEVFEVGEPLPDPRVEGEVQVSSGVDASGNPVAVGEASDFLVGYEDASGTVYTVAPGSSVSLPAGDYKPVVVAAPDAQAGFDLSEWTVTDWSCFPHDIDPGDTITLADGTETNCLAFVSNINVDLSITADAIGDVDYSFVGVDGAVDTEFEVEIEVESSDIGIGTVVRETVPFEVHVWPGDNMAALDTFVLSPGFTATLDESGAFYVITGESDIEPGTTTTVKLGLVLTAAEATSPFKACVVIPEGLSDRTHTDDCWEIKAIGDGDDGDGDGGTTPPSTTPVETPPATIDPTHPETSAPSTTKPVQPGEDEDGLAKTGADFLPVTALTLALLAGGGVLLTLQKRREQQS